MLPTKLSTILPLALKQLPSTTYIIPILTSSRRLYHSPKTIFDADDEPTKPVKKQDPDDKPWDGEEPVKFSVLRMIMDKYRAPLRVEGAARRNLPRPQPYTLPPTPISAKEKSPAQKQKEREERQRQMKQNRIVNAKEAAFEYKMESKYPTPAVREHMDENVHLNDTVKKSATKKDINWEDWDLRDKPISIDEMGIWSDEMIRSARARGEFDDLPGRGKPLKQDPVLNNPYVDRTEYFLNRILQRNGAAPPWVMMQAEVDTEVTTVKSQLNSAFDRCLTILKHEQRMLSKAVVLDKFESSEKSYFNKEMERINKRLRSYNVMCPSPVRKQLLDLDKEITALMKKHNI
ncbi:hypothetical protein BDB01DRAFT_793162 [Pilobolus umbonatus]|nr:hypothetical protein BDB01DRAFT_793162 [Pilobolus umbonatus]